MASMSRWIRSCRLLMLDIAASSVSGARRLRTSGAKASGGGWASGRPPVLRMMLALLGCRCRVQFAEQSVALLIRSGSEEQRVRRARVRVPLAELQGPQTVDLQRSPGCGVELTELHRLAGSPRADEIECVDLAVAEIPDQERAAECAKGRRRERE